MNSARLKNQNLLELIRSFLFALFLVLRFGEREGRTALRLRILRIGLLAISVWRAILAVAIRLATAVLLLLRLLLLLVLLLLRLLGGEDAVVVLGVLQIVFRHHAVAARIGIAGKLQIFFIHGRCVAADLNFRAIRIVGAVRVVVISAATTATAMVVIVLWPAAASTRAFHWCPSSSDMMIIVFLQPRSPRCFAKKSLMPLQACEVAA